MQRGSAWGLCGAGISCTADLLWDEEEEGILLSCVCVCVCVCVSDLHSCPGSKPAGSASQPGGRWPTRCPASPTPWSRAPGAGRGLGRTERERERDSNTPQKETHLKEDESLRVWRSVVGSPPLLGTGSDTCPGPSKQTPLGTSSGSSHKSSPHTLPGEGRQRSHVKSCVCVCVCVLSLRTHTRKDPTSLVFFLPRKHGVQNLNIVHVEIT